MSLSPISAPNFTQTPNILMDDWLPHLSHVELKVLMVIMRKTFGWQKVRDRISLSQLEKFTGSLRKAILKAVNDLQDKGLILKKVEGKIGTQKTYYELVILDNSNNSYPCPQDTPPPGSGIDNSNNSYQCPADTPPSVLRTPTKETLSKEKKETTTKKAEESSLRSSVVVSFCKDEGIEEGLMRNLEKAHSLEALENAIVFLSQQRQKPMNPYGWLKSCLENSWDTSQKLPKTPQERINEVKEWWNTSPIKEALTKAYTECKIVPGDDYLEFIGMAEGYIKLEDVSAKERIQRCLGKMGYSLAKC